MRGNSQGTSWRLASGSRILGPHIGRLEDLSRDDALSLLSRFGILGFDIEPARTIFARTLGRILDISVHRDARSDGTTAIEPAGFEGASRDGYRGFTRDGLPPHTDGSAHPVPPAVAAVLCLKPAAQGGESLLVDGQQVYNALREMSTRFIDLLCEPGSIRFGNGPGFASQIFLVTPTGRLAVRYRRDGLRTASPRVGTALAALDGVVASHTHRVRLEAGSGYLLQNTRWLHGRTAFTGDRLLLRILGNPGFTASEMIDLSGFEGTTSPSIANAVDRGLLM